MIQFLFLSIMCVDCGDICGGSHQREDSYLDGLGSVQPFISVLSEA